MISKVSKESAAKVSAILRDHASLSRDLQLGSNLHNAADWIDYMAAHIANLELQLTETTRDRDICRAMAEDNYAKWVAAHGLLNGGRNE